MAKQKGVIKIEGSMDDITFYKSQDGYLAKKKSSISKDRIKNDPNFARTLENDREFANAASSGKYLRDILRPLMKTAADGRVSSRLTKVMSQLLRLDTSSARGDRTVGVAIALPAALALLKGFEFNNRSQMNSILFKPYTVDTVTGKITIPNLVPVNDVAAPQGATHLTLRGGYANTDFTNGVSAIEYTNETNLPIDGTPTNVMLSPAGVPPGTGTKFFLLEIEFFQQVNAVQYELNNGAFNALVIAEVI